MFLFTPYIPYPLHPPKQNHHLHNMYHEASLNDTMTELCSITLSYAQFLNFMFESSWPSQNLVTTCEELNLSKRQESKNVKKVALVFVKQENKSSPSLSSTLIYPIRFDGFIISRAHTHTQPPSSILSKWIMFKTWRQQNWNDLWYYLLHFRTEI